MHMVVDEKSVFREDNFSKAVAAVGEASEAASKAGRERKDKKGHVAQEQESDIFKIVRMIMERGYDPVSTTFCYADLTLHLQVCFPSPSLSR